MADPYRDALNTLVGLGADRVLVLQGPAPLQARLSHGFDQAKNWSDQISLGVLEQPLRGEPLLLADVSQSALANRWSVQISGICSVVCVPFWSPSSRILGVLYADTRSLQRTFSRETIAAMQRCARCLEQSLYGASRPAAPPPAYPMAQEQAGIRLGLKRPQAALRNQPSVPISSRPIKRPDPRSLSVFVRSLATMVAAGLPLERSLSVLALHQPDRHLQVACHKIHHSVSSGNPLSGAMRSQRIFPALDCALLEVGERSGCLDRVLIQLAELNEKRMEFRLRLQNSLVYPAVLCLFSLAAVLLAPPFVLRGQFELLRQSGQKPPWLTQALVTFSDLLFSPPGMGLTLLVALVTTILLGRLNQRPAWRARAWEQLFRLPVLKPLLLHAGCARFAQALALTYRVGLPLPQGLELAAQASSLPQQQRHVPLCLEKLSQGQSVASSLAALQGLLSSFLTLVAAGEECGKLDSTLEWVARFYEAEFEANLESLMALLQPLLILAMGLLVGLLLLATLLPMVGLVEQL